MCVNIVTHNTLFKTKSTASDGRGSVVNATRRAGDVNPPVTVRARVAGAATGARQGRTGRLTSTARPV
jgi:hypothetical protein